MVSRNLVGKVMVGLFLGAVLGIVSYTSFYQSPALRSMTLRYLATASGIYDPCAGVTCGACQQCDYVSGMCTPDPGGPGCMPSSGIYDPCAGVVCSDPCTQCDYVSGLCTPDPGAPGCMPS